MLLHTFIQSQCISNENHLKRDFRDIGSYTTTNTQFTRKHFVEKKNARLLVAEPRKKEKKFISNKNN